MGLDRLSSGWRFVRRLSVTCCLLSVVSCGGENEPSVAGNTNASGSGAGKTDAGGTPGMMSSGAGTSSGAAGKATPSSGGNGGSTPSSSGGRGGSTASSSGGNGGSTPASSGGGSGGSTPSSSGGGGSGGSTPASGGSGGSPGSMMSGMFSPLCMEVPPTAAGQAPTKGGACTAEDTQLCYKTCGPQSIGFKSETCTNGAYVEQSGCTFTDMDYACFKIPMTQDASCPTMTPQANMPCDVAMCTLCNVGGMYLESGGGAKAGYCVCPMAGASGMRKWSCASTTAWPCPTGKGC